MTLDKAQDIVLENTAVEIILATRQSKDFVEVVGDAGGDIVTYRVYNDGSIYAK